MQKSLNEFEILPDATIGFHGNRYSYSWKNDVITFSQTFLIGFISYLQVTIIYIRPRTSELATFERLKKFP